MPAKHVFSKKPLLIVLMAAIIIGGAGYWYSSQKGAPQTHTVVLTENGFVPQEITIAEGDMVAFTATRQKPFWPASDLHPTHDIYAEFDPKEPIGPDKSWSLRFEREGEWKYHDHLAPVWRGTIVVRGQDRKTTNFNCTDQFSDRVKCWEKLVDNALKEKGLDSAFALIENLYNSEPQFPKVCHDMVHKAGAMAYNLFREGKHFALTPKTSVCEYGFFHGFTETLAAQGGSAKEAGSFCLTVSEKLGSQLPDVVWQCYHGLGHGSVNVHDKAIWGNERAMIAPALKLCNAVADAPQKLFRCGTGVFDSISIGYFSHTYGLEMKRENPFWLCREQENDELKKACYVSMNPALMVLNDLDFLRAAGFIERIIPKEHAAFAMGSLALPVFWVQNVVGKEKAQYIETFYINEGVNTCRALNPYLRLSCIQSIAHALTWHEVSQTQWQKGVAFCSLPSLSGREQATCFQSLVSALRAMHPVQRVNEICQSFDKPYREYCKQ